jgi:hypothetical protein
MFARGARAVLLRVKYDASAAQQGDRRYRQ